MAYTVEMTQPAERDLLEIYSYIAETLKEPMVAKRIYRSIKEEVLSLSFMPERHVIIDESPYAEAGVRRLLVENYIVFYIVDDNRATVTVLRILYHRREWHSILSKDYH